MPDLLLDFASRAIRRFYGLHERPLQLQRQIIGHWINISAWLAHDLCLVPVGLPLECELLRAVLERKDALLMAGIIQFPLRGSFEAFVARRRDTYQPYANDHQDLYRDEVVTFILRYAMAFKDRRRISAESLVDRWSSGPDLSPLWTPLKGAGLRSVQRLSRIPAQIHEHEAGIIWEAVRARLLVDDGGIQDQLNRILQSDFVESYCEEYGVDTLRDLPYGWRNLRCEPPSDPSLSYQNFRYSLEPLGIRGLVENLSADALVELRQCGGYLRFMNVYREQASNDQRLRVWAACCKKVCGVRGRLLEGNARSRGAPCNDWPLTQAELDVLDQLLVEAAALAPITPTLISEAGACLAPSAHQEGPGMSAKRVAIFVALEEERKILERSKFGFNTDRHAKHLVAERGSVTFEVYCAFGMGRVAAAVATMEYLQNEPKPDLLLVAGIAGGFEKVGAREGAVIIPEQIHDLAIRKIKGDQTEFRLESYRADTKLHEYLRSNLFNKTRWAEIAHEVAEWPEDLRPSIRYDALTSVDEVVSSIEHADALIAAIPKLAGVEMEAGGVFAAALKHEVKCVVVRAISDKADPAKADNEWRKRAMKTIVSLLDHVDWDIVLKK